MKKLITLVLALVLFSCAKEEKPEYTIISGKMTNTEDSIFTITGLSFEKEITVKPDGTFSDTLHLDYNGTYKIGNQSVYLEKGKNTILEADAKEIEKIKFTGDLANENNYIAEKGILSTEILGNPRDFYSLEETEFLAKLDSFEKKSNEILEKIKFDITDFKEKELKNIAYHKNFLLESYKNYHGYLTGKEDFKVSENFPKTDETIDFDNAADFDFSSPYRNLVQSNFQTSVQKEVNDGASYHETLLAKFKAVKSQNIKNSLAESLAYEINPVNEKNELFYNEILANSTNEKFKKELTEKYEKLKTLAKGEPSPKFNYENHKGGTTSLDDLKGKFVYIDVWATWCGPCIQEIPFMKEVEKKYHGKNIEFVSISIDNKKDYDTWKNFVTEKQMGGIQLFADNDWKSQFVQDYIIEGIPRFILIDTEGNIVSADAPRPSESRLVELFTELGL